MRLNIFLSWLFSLEKLILSLTKTFEFRLWLIVDNVEIKHWLDWYFLDSNPMFLMDEIVSILWVDDPCHWDVSRKSSLVPSLVLNIDRSWALRIVCSTSMWSCWKRCCICANNVDYPGMVVVHLKNDRNVLLDRQKSMVEENWLHHRLNRSSSSSLLSVFICRYRLFIDTHSNSIHIWMMDRNSVSIDKATERRRRLSCWWVKASLDLSFAWPASIDRLTHSLKSVWLCRTISELFIHDNVLLSVTVSKWHRCEKTRNCDENYVLYDKKAFESAHTDIQRSVYERNGFFACMFPLSFVQP